MRIHKCWFCGVNVWPGRGTSFVRNDCKVFRFCTHKCHANFKLKRNPRKLKWTRAWRQLRGRTMTVDKTFEFERIRNRPVKYDRELWAKTVAAMRRIADIKRRREIAFYVLRRRSLAGSVLRTQLKELEKYKDLVETPLALQQTNKVKVKLNTNKLLTMDTTAA